MIYQLRTKYFLGDEESIPLKIIKFFQKIFLLLETKFEDSCNESWKNELKIYIAQNWAVYFATHIWIALIE